MKFQRCSFVQAVVLFKTTGVRAGFDALPQPGAGVCHRNLASRSNQTRLLMKKSKSSMTTGTGRAPKAQPASRSSFPIVGIGASAGGLEVMTQLLKHLPARTGMAFVLVQHLDPTHESAL